MLSKVRGSEKRQKKGAGHIGEVVYRRRVQTFCTQCICFYGERNFEAYDVRLPIRLGAQTLVHHKYQFLET